MKLKLFFILILVSSVTSYGAEKGNSWKLPDGTSACCFGMGQMTCNGKESFELEVGDETGLKTQLSFQSRKSNLGFGRQVSRVVAKRGFTKLYEFQILNKTVFTEKYSNEVPSGAKVSIRSAINHFVPDFNERLACCQNDGEALNACLEKFGSAPKAKSSGGPSPFNQSKGSQ